MNRFFRIQPQRGGGHRLDGTHPEIEANSEPNSESNSKSNRQPNSETNSQPNKKPLRSLIFFIYTPFFLALLGLFVFNFLESPESANIPLAPFLGPLTLNEPVSAPASQSSELAPPLNVPSNETSIKSPAKIPLEKAKLTSSLLQSKTIVYSPSMEALPGLVLKKLKQSPLWPPYLRGTDLKERVLSRHRPGFNHEVFIEYEWRPQGFKIPQGSVRVLLFEGKKKNYSLRMADHRFPFSAPPLIKTPLLREEEALTQLQKTIGQLEPGSLWQMSGIWLRRQNQWVPQWQIQLFGSDKTYYVDAIKGEISSTKNSYGVQNRVPVFGRGTPLMAPPLKTEALPLAKVTLVNAKGKTFQTDEDGVLFDDINPGEKMNVILKNESLEVKNSLRKQNLEATWILGPQIQSLVVNPSSEEEQTAQINAFYFIQLAKNYLIKQLQFSPMPLNKKLLAKVNRTDEMCSASYLNGVLSFDRASDECRNTAFDTIILHEFTHYVDDVYGGIQDRALSEGMGDIFSTFITGQPILGNDLFKTLDAYLRSTDSEIVFKDIGAPLTALAANSMNPPPPPSPEMEPDFEEEAAVSYNNGQAWASFAWRVRTDLIAKYGEKGRVFAENLFLPLLETNPPDIMAALNEVFARLGQGQEIELAPDFELIENAAMHHGFFWMSPKNQTKKFAF